MNETAEDQKPGSGTRDGDDGAAAGGAASAAAGRPLPLDQLHRRAAALMTERDGWAVPAYYGDVAAEYGAVRDGAGAGLFDLSARARLEVRGSEAVQFLNGLITNDVKALADGAWMQAAFPNVQGRLMASVRVIRRGDCFLFDTEAATHAAVFRTLERFTLAGDFRVRDTTGETVNLSVQGARAAGVVRTVFGDAAADVARGRVVSAPLPGERRATLLRATHTAEDGFDLLVDRLDAEDLWRALTEAGARPVGAQAQEILRIEAGLARYGIDVGETNVVLEAVDASAVSFTKGCYIGQEIIARIHWRGHVAKKLTGLVFGEASGALGGATLPGQLKVKAAGEDKEVGRVTSFAYSPHLKRVVALAIVKYDYLAPGTGVQVVAGSGEVSAAQVAGLPLVRGSWYGPERVAESDG